MSAFLISFTFNICVSLGFFLANCPPEVCKCFLDFSKSQMGFVNPIRSVLRLVLFF